MHDADDWISKMVERIEELMIEQIIAVSHIHDFFKYLIPIRLYVRECDFSENLTSLIKLTGISIGDHFSWSLGHRHNPKSLKIKKEWNNKDYTEVL